MSIDPAMRGAKPRMAKPRIVLTWIRRKHLTEFTVRDVRRGLGGQEWAKDVEEIRAALDELEDLGWVQMLPPPDTGSRAGRKPSERYAVNPVDTTGSRRDVACHRECCAEGDDSGH